MKGRNLENDASISGHNVFWPLVLDIVQKYSWNPEGIIDGMCTEETGWEKAQYENTGKMDG